MTTDRDRVAAPASATLRLLIVDDHPVVRDGIRGMLEHHPRIEVVGEASDGREAVDLTGRLDPDLVLMDLRMPGADGHRVLDPAAVRSLMDRGRADELTERERQVLLAVARGGTNREIARQLLVSEATVKTHLLHLYPKLGVRDRAAAVRVAYQRGMLE